MRKSGTFRAKLFGCGLGQNLMYLLVELFLFLQKWVEMFKRSPSGFWTVLVNVGKLRRVIDRGLTQKTKVLIFVHYYNTRAFVRSGNDNIIPSFEVVEGSQQRFRRRRAFLCDIVECDRTQGGGCQVFSLGSVMRGSNFQNAFSKLAWISLLEQC